MICHCEEVIGVIWGVAMLVPLIAAIVIGRRQDRGSK